VERGEAVRETSSRQAKEEVGGRREIQAEENQGWIVANLQAILPSLLVLVGWRSSLRKALGQAGGEGQSEGYQRKQDGVY